MVTGIYRVAMVNFLKGTNTTKKYAFALFDSSIGIDDIVLCDTSIGYQLAKVVDIVEQLDYNGTNVTKEVICKVDFTDFNKRAEERKRKAELKAKMDAMVKDDKELMLYQMLAEKNPAMKEMLDEYKNINV
jgi:hypothetical protein